MFEKILKALGYVKIIENMLCSNEAKLLDTRLSDIHGRLTKLELTSQGLYDQVLRKIQKKQEPEVKKSRFFAPKKPEYEVQ